MLCCLPESSNLSALVSLIYNCSSCLLSYYQQGLMKYCIRLWLCFLYFVSSEPAATLLHHCVEEKSPRPCRLKPSHIKTYCSPRLWKGQLWQRQWWVDRSQMTVLRWCVFSFHRAEYSQLTCTVDDCVTRSSFPQSSGCCSHFKPVY